MFLGNADFGGSATSGGQWIDVRPPFDASIDVWRQALSMAYAGKGIGPDGIGAALAERYLFDSQLPEWVIKAVSEFASAIAQISNKITVDTILKGVEFAVNNIPPYGLDEPGSYGAWRALTIASLNNPTQYPIDYDAFGDDDTAGDDFVTHIVAPSKVIPTKTTSIPGKSYFEAPQTTAPAVIQKNTSVNQYLEPASNTSGIRIAAIAAALASFLI